MKSKFTNTEIGTIASTISSNINLSLRINKCGNIDVAHKDAESVHFVFHKYSDGYSVRKVFGTFRGKEQHGGALSSKRFSTIKEVSSFFSKYMETHKESLTKSYSSF